ncbi:hypothetical protein VTI28DRAFT_4629 [Corynascus sepedonium]
MASHIKGDVNHRTHHTNWYLALVTVCTELKLTKTPRICCEEDRFKLVHIMTVDAAPLAEYRPGGMKQSVPPYNYCVGVAVENRGEVLCYERFAPNLTRWTRASISVGLSVWECSSQFCSVLVSALLVRLGRHMKHMPRQQPHQSTHPSKGMMH